jgi:predicted HAD superfamily Cof-like phosphohydrolase
MESDTSPEELLRSHFNGAVQSRVAEFHRLFDFTERHMPYSGTVEDRAFRLQLLTEELGEVAKALRKGNINEIALELADLAYVTYGTAVTLGFDLDAAIAEVHRANCTKSPPVHGKPVKDAAFEPADPARAVHPWRG